MDIPWRGGLLPGGIAESPVNKCCTVSIQKKGAYKYTKVFYWATHGGPATARLKAEQHLREKVEEFGAPISNQWRLVCDRDTGAEHAEMLLHNGFVVKFDIADLPRLQGICWSKTLFGQVHYATSSTYGMMHNYITGWKKVDHINHNG